MTPTSPLAGLLTGLVAGLVIAAAVFLVVQLDNRRRNRVGEPRRPVADDRPSVEHPLSPEGDIPRAA